MSIQAVDIRRIAVLNIPFKTIHDNEEKWITIPPQGYGGIQWMVATLCDALLARGHIVYLLGAPGSKFQNTNIKIIDAAESADVQKWLVKHSNEYEIIHDFSDGKIFDSSWIEKPWISTHHFTSPPKNNINVVYVSQAQKESLNSRNAPVIRIPVNPQRYHFSEEKLDFLLFLGRISPWKGAQEAAHFAKLCNRRLKLVGPAWEDEYLKTILSLYPEHVEWCGEIGGSGRLDLLASASALLAFSQPIMGPWGNMWCEPGSTVVSEAAISGTPVLASDNGCLKEIVPAVGVVIKNVYELSENDAKNLMKNLPNSNTIRKYAEDEWGHLKIIHDYEEIYRRAIESERWT